MQAPTEILDSLRDIRDNLEVLLAVIEKAESVSDDVNEMYLAITDNNVTDIIETVTDQFMEMSNVLNDLGDAAEYDLHTSEEDTLEK